MVMTPDEATHIRDSDGNEKRVMLGNVYESSYVPNRWMPYKQFQRNFKYTDENGHVLINTQGAEAWLEGKMLISEEEAHNAHQTGRG
jgi:adenosine deaminase CECR1